MSTAALMKRSQMEPMGRAVRAYVAPVDRNSGAVTPFDPGVQGQFDPDAPPAPWLDLGWVENLQRTSPTKYGALRSGARGTVTAQYRAEAEARMEFDLPEWGKLQMAIAGGSQQLNVLATVPGAQAEGSGGAAIAAVPAQPGSLPIQIALTQDQLPNFNLGDVLAVDMDYAGTAGYVGSGVPGAYLATALDVATHVDLIRRVTFNITRVAAKTANVLIVAPPLLAIGPMGFGVQKVVAFVDREGSGFFQEWSVLLVAPSDSGGRICFYYPRMQAAQSSCENRRELPAPVFNTMLHASLLALPTTDPNDGETVLCYRSYFPASTAAPY